MRVLLVIMAASVVASCASAGAAPRARSSPDELTREEIEAADRFDAYEIVRTLRPRWLLTRGPTSVHLENPVVIYVDGARMGGPDALRDVHRPTIRSMRYYSPSAAQAKWGLNHTNGAIEVITGA